MPKCLAAALAWIVLGGLAWSQGVDRWRAARERMVTDDVAGAGVKDPRVLEALRTTPRHEFVPAEQRANAYLDMALPIGESQTISPPFIVAYMTEQLLPQAKDVVLEIGTGSGYQAAVLSPLVKDVYTIEIVEALGQRAAATLKRLGYKNVHPRIGDGYQGWPEKAPFDKIIVTCSPENIPQPLVDQLKEGGRMVVPVGERYQQTLYLFKKVKGKLESEALEPTMFVPMTGAAEEERVVKPDPTRPALVNGGFEDQKQRPGLPDAWYYVRQARVAKDSEAPQGKSCLTVTNAIAGRTGQALQAFGIDGRQVQELEVRLWVRAQDVEAGQAPDQLPRMLIHWFDANRAPAGQASIGPWQGTFDWTEKRSRLKVPRSARLAIVMIGLLGATGECSYDGIELKAIAAKVSPKP